MTTLPGSIPGLLRDGSPVVLRDGRSGIVIEYGAITCAVAVRRPEGGVLLACLSPSDLELDLLWPTGRVHAAWWAGSRMDEVQVWPQTPGSPEEAILLAQGNGPMPADQVAALHRLVLRLAGVAS